MAINIDDDLKRKAIKLLEDEQNQLKDAFSKQSPRGSFGMESEFIPEISELTQRKEKRITKDSKGRYSSEEVTVNQKYYDENVVDDQEKKIKEDAETLQEVCRAYDNEIIRLNGIINDKKQTIVDLSTIATTGNCWPGTATSESMPTVTKDFATYSAFNQDTEKTKIYTKMAGPGFNPGAENPFDPDTTVTLDSSYSGFGYRNFENNPILFVKNSSGTGLTTTGVLSALQGDGSGSGIGTARFDISTDSNDHTTPTISAPWQYAGLTDDSVTDASDCVGIANSITNIYLEIIDLRRERDSYRNKLNVLKDNKKEKELSYWGVQNTKNEVNVRKNKNKAAINVINDLDDADPIQEGLVLYYDSTDNSSYYGSGDIWYDISNEDNGADDNAGIDGDTFQSPPGKDPYFHFSSSIFDSGRSSSAFTIQDESLAISTEIVTVEMIAKLNIDFSDTDNIIQPISLFSWGRNKKYGIIAQPDLSSGGIRLGYTTGNGDLYGIDPVKSKSLGLSNIWHHYVFEMTRHDGAGGGTYKNNKIYVDGNEILSDTGNISPEGLTNYKLWTPVFDNVEGNTTISTDYVSVTSSHIFTKIDGLQANKQGWDASVYSEEKYPRCWVSARLLKDSAGNAPIKGNQFAGKSVMVGLNTDPSTDASYTSIDYQWYMHDNGYAYIYENANDRSWYGQYDDTTVLLITYDGEYIRYYLDRVLKRIIHDPGKEFAMDSSFYYEGVEVEILFGNTDDLNITEPDVVEQSYSLNQESNSSNVPSENLVNLKFYGHDEPLPIYVWGIIGDSPPILGENSTNSMDLSLFKVYNKALTQDEVTENYIANKSRLDQ